MILVTGAAGFIGSNIVASLNRAGRADLLLCDRLRSDGKWQNLRKASFADWVTPEALPARLAAGPRLDAVIHMGAISATTATDGDAVMASNFRLSVDLLDHCTAAAVPLVYASSAAVYGDGERGFEDDWSPAAVAALRPLNLYGWSKRQFDGVVADRIARGEPMPPTCAGLRYFNVYGPNEYHKGDMRSMVAKIAGPVAAGERVQLFRSHRDGIADGDQRRDFIHVEDAVAMTLAFLDRGPVTGIFNIGTGRARSFRELAEAVFAACGRPPAIDYVDMPDAIRGRYQYYTQARLERLAAAGVPAPTATMEQRIGDYVRGYLLAEDPYR